MMRICCVSIILPLLRVGREKGGEWSKESWRMGGQFEELIVGVVKR